MIERCPKCIGWSHDGPCLLIDSINPPHYAVLKPEPIDVIEGWRLGYNLGNVVKYVARAGRKGDKGEDLRKAIWYLERELSRK